MSEINEIAADLMGAAIEHERDSRLLASLDAYAEGKPDPHPPTPPEPLTLEYVQKEVAELLAEADSWRRPLDTWHEREDMLYQGIVDAVIEGNPDAVAMAKIVKRFTEVTWYVTRYYI